MLVMPISKKNIVSEKVVKTHRLNMAIQNLSLAEIRLMQLAIIDARETGKGIDTVTPLEIHASRYAQAFDVTRQTAYTILKDAELNLFRRYFTFLDEMDNKPVRSHWISQAKYRDEEACIEIMLTPAVVKEITRIDAKKAKNLFTQYALEQISTMRSVYSVRLYELLVQWKKRGSVTFDLDIFRGQLGLEKDDYVVIGDFKKRVLDHAVKEINEKSDIKVSYTNVKKGRKVTGFDFKVHAKKTEAKAEGKEEGSDSEDKSRSIDGLTDKQLIRITRHKDFVSAYVHLAGRENSRDWNLYSKVMVDEIKKDPAKFSKKRPIREYLEGRDEDYQY